MKRLLRISPVFILLGLMMLSNCKDEEAEVKPQISFQTTESTVTEGETVTVAFTMPLPSGVTPVFTLGGTATQGADYTVTVTPNGLVFTTIDDDADDPNETIIITLTGMNGNALLGPNRIHTITIHQPALVVEFKSPSSTVAEGNNFTVEFKRALREGVNVVVELTGTAEEDDDFTFSITPAGIVFNIIEDELYDPDETIVITLKEVTGFATLGTDLVHTVTITEPPIEVEFESVLSTASEGEDHTILFNIVLPEGVVPSISLGGTATEGADYTYAINADGILFSIIDDGLYDPYETIEVTLTEITGNAILGDATNHIINITEPPLVIEFASPSSTVSEGEDFTAAFNMILPQGVIPAISLTGSATEGSDYTYTITSNGIAFHINDDGLYDPDETIIITLTGVSGNAILGTNITHTITITDIPLVVEFQSASSTVAEGQDINVPYTITLPEGVTPSISLGGTATQGTDYTYSITATGIVFTTLDDGLYDPDETIVVTLTGVSGNAGLGVQTTHTITITEPPVVVAFESASSSAGEGSEVTIAFKNLLPDQVVPTISLGGTATVGDDYTYSITATGILLTIVDDGLYDPNETVIITLTGASGNSTLGTIVTHSVTITEPPLVVEFESVSSTVGEGENTHVAFNMTLPEAVIPNISLAGTATEGTDYTYTLTPSGISFTVAEDGLYDPNETIIITLTSISGNAVLGTNKVHTIIITEPPLIVEFESGSSSADEGDVHNVAFNMTLPDGVVPSISLDGTATQGADYTYEVTPGGIVLTINDDGVYDPNETIIITLTAVSGNAELGTQTTHTVTITEPPVIVGFASASSVVPEGEALMIAFTRVLPDEVVPVISLGGTATEGDDYTVVMTQSGISLTIIDDGLYDPNETIIITLTEVSGNAELGAQTTHTVTITEPPLVIEFTSVSSTVEEGEEINVAFNMTLPGEVVPAISLGGTATEGTDYTYVITPTGIVFTVAADGLYDPNETIVITLTGISGNAELGTNTIHTVTITEPPIVIEFQTDASSAKEGEATVVAFNRILPEEVTPTVTLGGTATLGVDYTYTITPNGLAFNLIFDEIYDPDETVIITLTSVTGNAVLGSVITHTLTITELPLVVEFAAAASSANEGQVHTVDFNMTLPAGVTPTISLGGTAAQGTDYTYSVTQSGIVFTLIEDGIYEPEETIVITMTGISGNAELGDVITHTVTVTDPPLVVEFNSPSSTAAEGESHLVMFNITLPDEVVPAFSLGGSATAGIDYSYTLTNSGISFTLIDDGLYDPDETIVITLTGVSGNAELGTLITHTVTLTEPPLIVEFGSSSSTAEEGQVHTVVYNMTLPDGVVPTISLSGTATAGTDYTYVITSEGVAFTLIADGLYDPNETIVITLTGVSGNAELGALITHTVTITEPPLIVEFDSPSSTAAEGQVHTVLYNMTLPEGVVPALSLGGTATEGTDYTYAITSTGIVFTLVADGLYDPNETIVVTLTGISGNAELGAVTVHTITITEPPLVVEFTSPSSTVGEGEDHFVTFNITLPDEVQPTFSLGGSAAAGTDYTYTLTPTGISFTIMDDGLYDPNETIVITLTGVSGNAELGDQIVHTVTITEPPLIVEFASGMSEVTEGEEITVLFNMTLPEGVTPSVSLTGTATQNDDYTYTLMADGIVISTTADAVSDHAETIVITLTGITGNAELGAITTHTVTINEPPLVVEFASPSSSVNEGEGITVPFNVTLPEGINPSITLTGTARIGVDYTHTVTSEGIIFNVVNDGIYETDETIVITITGVSGNAELGETTVHIVTIIETPLVVQFTTASSSVTEGQNGSVAFNMVLPEGIVPTVMFEGTATEGVDYTYSINSSGIIVATLEDWTPDPNETVIMTITEISGNAVIGIIPTHTLTILDPPAPVIEFAEESSTVAEGDENTVMFTVPLPDGVLPIFTLEGTATLGVDYSYEVVSDGILFTIHTDGFDDPDEAIVITLTGFNTNNAAELGTTLTHTVTITDEPLLVEFAAESSNVLEGSNILVAFNASLTGGTTPTISLGGTATEDVDYTYQVTPDGILISTLEDWFADPDETIEITLTGIDGNGVLGSLLVHTVTILDPPAQEVEFITDTSEGEEGDVITVLFNNPLPEGVIPTISLSGTATQGLDYTYSINSESIVFSLINDGLNEPDETIVVTLTGFNNNLAELGSNIMHTITISDVPLVVEFALESSEVLEGATSLIAFKLPLSGDAAPVISVGGTTTLGSDYTYSVTQAGIVITVIEDWFADPDETLIFTITNVSGHAVLGSSLTHTVTLVDPPAPVIEFAADTSSVVEGQGVTVLYNTPLPAGVFPIITLNGTAIYETDYLYTFSTTGINIFPSNDGIVDPDETIIITITGFTASNVAELGGNLTHTVTITDAPITIDFTSAGVVRTEGTAAIAAFSQSLPLGVTPIYSISGTATQGVDYTISQGVNSFVISTLKDEIYDPGETVIIELLGFTGNAELGPNTIFTLTIQDEDEIAVARLVIDLTWDVGNGTPGDVDMDILLWRETSPGSNQFILEAIRDNLGPVFESLTFSATLQNVKWGLSYVYYSGTSDNVAVTVSMRSYKGNINETSNRKVFHATYKLANINPWADTQDFQIEQYFDKAGANYNNVTDIIVPEAGSRVKKPVFIVDEEVLKRESIKANR